MYHKTEQEIMQNWKGDNNEPVVSICSITYNHENYIAEAIDSFLMQETNFPFEVLINEDCSTDNTANIIREYEKKYPNIIKPIYQKENQYSKGFRMNPTFNYPRAKGKYIALCEGDDYWTDPKKLQIQIDEMKKNPDVNISFHPSHELIDNMKGNTLSDYSEQNKIFTTSEVILGGGNFIPTASLIIKKEVVENLPSWFYTDAPVGDYFIQILGSIKGGALYINKCMAIYRKGHSGSWSMEEKDFQKIRIWREKYILAMKKLNEETGYKYDKEINKYLVNLNYRVLGARSVSLEYKRNIYDDIKNSLSITEIFLWHAVLSKPKIYDLLKTIKDKM